MGGGSWCWENYKEFFKGKGYNCITPALRFHDVDPEEPPDSRLGTTSLLDYANDIEGEIKKLNATPILMGHSMGGLLAQILGSRGIGKALVLLTPAPPYGIMTLNPSVIRGFKSILKVRAFWKKPVRQTFNEASFSALHLLPEKEQEEIYNKSVYESGRVICEIGLWFLDFKRAARVDESKINCPVLVISGTKDRIISSSCAKKIADKYKPYSTYKEFKNHAHWVLGQPGWQEIVKYIYNWLKKI